MYVMFATKCDTCGKRSAEYSTWPTCSECMEHACPTCDIPAKRTEDERDETLCKKCAAEAIIQ